MGLPRSEPVHGRLWGEPFDRLPRFGRGFASNPVQLWLEAYSVPGLLLGLAMACVVVVVAGVSARPGLWLGAAGLVIVMALGAFMAVAVVQGVGAMRAWVSSRRSRALGLRSVVLLTVSPGMVRRLGIRLPADITNVVELHVHTGLRWRDRGMSPEEAARRFQGALWADYDRIVHGLLPASPGTAFMVSTWHRVPPWLAARCEKAGLIVRGPHPRWVVRVGERHRRRAQRRMFGALLGRPVSDPGRWRTYVVWGGGKAGERP